MNAILQTCIAIEERIGVIYSELTAHPDANEELQEIWREMAEDEARHAHRIRLVADRLQIAGITELGLDGEEMQALLDRAGEVLQDVQDGALSLDEAIFVSVELEDAFMKAHLASGDVGGQPDLQTMFRSLAEEDRKHTEKLKSYLARMSDGAGLEFGSGDD